MIAVVADDFTGAAELAGIALQYNLSVKLCTYDITGNDVDVLIVSTNSRSLNKADAIEVTKKAVNDLQKLKPAYIYKKVDSVLRGYVLDELAMQMSVLGLKKALLIPANPSLGRQIIDKNYYVHNVKISETSFANDPEFAIKDASVAAMLKATTALSILKHTEKLPLQGVVVGEVTDKADIKAWIDKVDSGVLLAGAGDFFDQLLQEVFIKTNKQDELRFLSPHLYVSGTSFQKSTALINSIAKSGGQVHYMSHAVMQSMEDEAWFQQISQAIRQHQKAVIAIDGKVRKTLNISALALRNAMAKTIAKIVAKENISELFIEGGSTAAAILQALGLQTFTPTHQLSRGVIRMKALQKELYITVKPGSYELPKQISKLYLSSL